MTIDGYEGQSIDFGVRSDWTAMCPDIDPVNPVVLMLTSTNTDPPGRDLAYAQDVRVRWIVLDVAGETVIVEVVGPGRPVRRRDGRGPAGHRLARLHARRLTHTDWRLFDGVPCQAVRRVRGPVRHLDRRVRIRALAIDGRRAGVGPCGRVIAACGSVADHGAPPAAFECDDFTTGCAGNLTAGVHSSSNFTIPLTLTVPDGWVNVRDIVRTYEVEPASSSGVPGHPDIEVLAMNAIPDQASCGPVPLAGAGSTVTDFVDFVSHHPGLDATAPAPVTIDGYQGQSIDFGVRSDWTAMCPDIDPVNPVALMLTSTNTDPPGRHLAYAQDVRVRWIVLDVAGETVIVEMVARCRPVRCRDDRGPAGHRLARLHARRLTRHRRT